MFNKKSCRKCGKKIHKDFEYCPHCGYFIGDKQKEQEDYGFLGKSDVVNSFPNELRLPLGLNTLFKKLMKEMDKQFQELDREIGKEKEMTRRMPQNREDYIKQGGISINISSGAGKPVIRVKSFGNMPEFKGVETQIKNPRRTSIKPALQKIDEEKVKKLAKLPREEATSKVRRLSGKVIYELDLPDVKDIKDIIVNQLENSIEVKAFAKDKAYFKFLPVSLPLLKYQFGEGKLILELGEG
ncbi:hypothetical protein A3K73_06460 [Candidatus Pacearchaeota archaeon RBG_13_36_9]|nr:MAG: hypothetical protein A3K73_06460 [Candidatus Pacearchaeota archaeon RBG_13_36_9]